MIEGNAPQSVESDIFSLGLVFYNVSKVFENTELRQMAKLCTRSNPALRCKLSELLDTIKT